MLEERMPRGRPRGRGWLLLGLLALLASGCAEVQDEVTIAKDGTVAVRIETRGRIDMNNLMARGHAIPFGETPQAFHYPPFSEEEAKTLFPGAELEVKPLQDENGMTVGVAATAKYADIGAFLRSPYADAHALTLAVEEGVLRLRTRTGLQAVGALAASESKTLGMFTPIQKKTYLAHLDKLAYRLTVRLPAAATAEGAAVEGNSVTWRIDGAELADAPAAAAAFGRIYAASCPADGIAFAPVGRPRLDLVPFADLEERTVVPPTREGLKADIRKRGRFLPVMIQVKRSFDLAGGHGFYGENEMRFVGAVELPEDLAPTRWGRLRMTEATDDQEFSLLPDNPNRHSWDPYRHINDRMRMMGGNDGTVRRIVSAELETPSFEAKTLAVVRGEMELVFGGPLHVVKLPGAVPADTIKEGHGGYSSSSNDALTHPKLGALGLKLSRHVGQRIGGVVMFGVSVESETAFIDDICAFDGEGNPWPTFVANQNGGGGRRWLQVLVVGEPKGDLSLALVAQGQGEPVAIPFELKNVPILPDPAAETEDANDDNGDAGDGDDDAAE